jgi:hypothetical protein
MLIYGQKFVMLMEKGEQTLDKNSIVWTWHAGGV